MFLDKKLGLSSDGIVGALIIFALLALAVSPVEAMNIFGFTKLTNNNVEDISSQLSIEAVDIGGNRIRFDVRNNMGVASNVAEVYFDDDAGVLLSSSIRVDIDNGPGTDFVAGENIKPKNMPSGKNVGFHAYGLGADVKPGQPAKGINDNNDVLGVIFDIVGDQDFGDVIAALNAQTLRSGLHVRSIGVAGGSDSYVGGGPTSGNPVPEPSTYALFGLGLGALLWRHRKLKKK